MKLQSYGQLFVNICSYGPTVGPVCVRGILFSCQSLSFDAFGAIKKCTGSAVMLSRRCNCVGKCIRSVKMLVYFRQRLNIIKCQVDLEIIELNVFYCCQPGI